MRMKIQRIKDVFPNFKTDTYFFTKLFELVDVGIPPDTVSKYYFTKSLNRIISPITDVWHDDNEVLASFIATAYKKKWEQSLEVIKLEYAPADNYNMVENSTDVNEKTSTNIGNENSTDTGKISTTIDNTITYGKTNKLVDTTTDNGTNASDGTNNKYGVNTTSAHPDTSFTNKETSSNTNSKNATSTDGGVDVTKNTNVEDNTNTSTKELNYNTSENEEITHTLTRKGNIGVTTTQQMIQSDIDLWKWIFLDDIVKDINTLLTLSIY